MNGPIVFLHGWAGDLEIYGRIPQMLLAAGFQVRQIHLGQYATGADDLSIDDFAMALQAAIAQREISAPFDVVIHSTGALVVRRWLSLFHRTDARSPIRHLIMAGPVNNGSRLAGWGRKLPWDWGNKVLHALRLGSPFTWELNLQWMREARHAMPGLKLHLLLGAKADIALPGFLDRLDDLFSIDVPAFEEAGSDSTVRFAAANLNMQAVRIAAGGDMSAPLEQHAIRDIPIHVFANKSHFSAKHGILGSVRHPNDSVFQTVLGILQDQPPEPADLADLPRKLDYLMLVIRVVDQLGQPFEHFIPHFYFGTAEDRKHIELVHRDENAERDCFYVHYRDLSAVTRFGFQIQANRIGCASYAASQRIDLLYPAAGIRFLQPHQTHFVEVAVHKSLDEKAMRFTHPIP